jgi:polyhydroxyalkanoate synthesis regulator phasin
MNSSPTPPAPASSGTSASEGAIDLLKQAIFTSIGLATLAKDKAQQLAAEVSTRAKLSEQDARDFAEELNKRIDQARQELNSEVDKRIDSAMIQFGLVKAGVKKASDDAANEAESFVDARLSEAFDRLRVARQEDIDSLQQRIERLERKLSDLQGS